MKSKKTEQKKALVLGGTASHCELISNLKNRGYFTILVDYLPNPPARDCADMHLQVSCLDYNEVLALAREYLVDTVVTTHLDRTIPVACAVNEALDFSYYLSSKQAEVLTNKVAMKQMFSSANILTSRWGVVSSPEGQEMLKLSPPLICKEVDGTGSQGLVIVKDQNAFSDVSKVTFSCSNNKPILVEEFQQGCEFSVDCIINDGNVQLLAVRERKKVFVSDGESLLCHGALRLIHFPEGFLDRLLTIGQSVADEVGLRNSPLMIQVILTESGDLSVVEVAARISGGITSYYLEEATGVDLLDFSVACQINELPNVRPCANDSVYAVKILYAKEGRIREIIGFDECLAAGLIENYQELRKDGDEVPSEVSTKSRVAEFIIRSATVAEINLKLDQIFEHLAVLDHRGEDILIRDDEFKQL